MTFLPMTVGNMFEQEHYVNLDTWLIMILLINGWLLTTKKRGATFISSVLVVTGMLIHSVYAFLFFAGTFNLLLWLYWKTKNKNYLVAAIIDTALVIALLLYFNSGKPILFMPYEEIESYVKNRTSETLTYGLHLIPLWFNSTATTIRDAYKQNLFYHVVHETIVFYLLMLPVITWIFAFWHRYYKHSGKPKIFWIFALSLISVLPCHMYQTDHGRWIAGVFWSQLALLFSVINYDDCEEEREIFTKLFYEKSEIYRWGLLIYMLIIGPVSIITVNKPLHRIFRQRGFQKIISDNLTFSFIY